MEYLKIFEEYSNTYYKISSQEYHDTCQLENRWEHLEPITDEEYNYLDTNLKMNRTDYPLDYINKKFKHPFKKKQSKSSNDKLLSHGSSLNDTSTTIELGINNNIYFINKIEDEWWYINEQLYYKDNHHPVKSTTIKI